MRCRARKAFIVTSWVPPALWVATALYVDGLEGWGAWAAAPMLLPAIFLGTGMGMAGTLGLLLAWRRCGHMDWPLLAASLLAASAVLASAVSASLR